MGGAQLSETGQQGRHQCAGRTIPHRIGKTQFRFRGRAWLPEFRRKGEGEATKSEKNEVTGH